MNMKILRIIEKVCSFFLSLGGYHPVTYGDLYHNERYKVLKKLGWGHFSTVWFALDTLASTFVALKIVKSDKRYMDAAFDEIKLLEQASGNSSERKTHRIPYQSNEVSAEKSRQVVKLLDHFTLMGPHGERTSLYIYFRYLYGI